MGAHRGYLTTPGNKRQAPSQGSRVLNTRLPLCGVARGWRHCPFAASLGRQQLLGTFAERDKRCWASRRASNRWRLKAPPEPLQLWAGS
eukprot:6857082-Pyramimonas_sp.AAC.1